MPTYTAVIQFSTDDPTIHAGIASDLITAIDSWPESVDVSQATITDDIGGITELIEYEDAPASADPPASSGTETTDQTTQAPAQDPDADPKQSLPTGSEF